MFDGCLSVPPHRHSQGWNISPRRNGAHLSAVDGPTEMEISTSSQARIVIEQRIDGRGWRTASLKDDILGSTRSQLQNAGRIVEVLSSSNLGVIVVMSS